MKITIPITITLAMALAFASCKKYPQGPGISFRSKKERISNKWSIYKVYEGGSDKTADYKNVFYNWISEIKTDGNYVITYRPGNIFDYKETGKWKFTENNSKIFLDKDDSNEDGSWTILKLEEKEVWVKTIYDNKEIELRIIPSS